MMRKKGRDVVEMRRKEGRDEDEITTKELDKDEMQSMMRSSREDDEI